MKMRIKILSILLTCIMVSVYILSFEVVAVNDDITVIVDGEIVVFPDQQPVIIDGRTLVPARGVFEMLGFEVEWITPTPNDVTPSAIFRNDRYEIRLWIGRDIFSVNGHSEVLDVPAQIINGRTMIPLRIAIESGGYFVEWDSANHTALISTTPFPGTTVLSGAIPRGRPIAHPGQGLPSQEELQEWLDVFIPTEFELAVAYEINRVRAEYGLHPLTWRHELAVAAALRTAYLRESGYNSRVHDSAHTFGSFDSRELAWLAGGSGNFNWGGGMSGASLAPNDIARVNTVEPWLRSPVHRANVLSPYHMYIGVGSSRGGGVYTFFS